jgi:hypothetical protein
MSKTVKKTVNPLFSDIPDELTDTTITQNKGPTLPDLVSPAFRKFLIIISAIVALYLIIITSVSRTKLMPYLVVGLLISFILKTCFDVIKLLEIVKNKDLFTKIFNLNELRMGILAVGIVLYLFFIYTSGHMYHVVLKNIKSKCLPKIINFDAFAVIYIVLLLFDNVILHKPEMYLFSIIIYVCIGLAMMLNYKKEIHNLKNKLEDNCTEQKE